MSLRGVSVFVQFVVSLVDSSGTPAATTLSASLPVAQGGVNSWCFAEATQGYNVLDYVDGVDLIVGSAGTAADLGALKTVALPLSTIGPPNMTSSPASRSAPVQHGASSEHVLMLAGSMVLLAAKARDDSNALAAVMMCESRR